MPSVERTAYPRFSRSLTAQELSRFFTSTEEELALARAEARGERHQLCFLTLLKCFQRLHWPQIECLCPNFVLILFVPL